MTIEEAAIELGVSAFRIGVLGQNGILAGADTDRWMLGTPHRFVPGVSRASVEAELAWQRTATRSQRFWRRTRLFLATIAP